MLKVENRKATTTLVPFLSSSCCSNAIAHSHQKRIPKLMCYFSTSSAFLENAIFILIFMAP